MYASHTTYRATSSHTSRALEQSSATIITTATTHPRSSLLARVHNITATNQVLATAELLELILLDLPPRDLLSSQRVCTTWRHAVKASVKAQRALFRRPQPATTPEEGVPPPPPTANPFLPRDPRILGSKIHLKYDHLRALDKRGARKMLVCQPPLKRVEVYGRLGSDRAAYNSKVIARERGVKVKHLVRLVKKMKATTGWVEIVGSEVWQKA
ncbi:uncharacterized protein CLAFUR5_05313 [Fulvia fulva]|uniref:F-box domain-containing protein n=1 Tax=Passalora fulva TaxID=5499 RepID=A0A9Q8P7A3_PASFU|nr:uncharacterized protein CLAFUR5_05313 [Fulvia fulva]KAK4616615.1 hypothetical protein CLAFUR0_10710 [Fulvia fulva]UJO15945.1 hypothetical protein CLAFUR5_05313 [Fulvia fulva]